MLQSYGSSPLTRGTREWQRWQPNLIRFIPAHAGNTARPRIDEARLPVHPRSRGEHPAHERISSTFSGSSPLTRGTRQRLLFLSSSERFIPAHAGNTHTDLRHRSSFTVHPRSRGEHASSSATRCRLAGSSPLTRGTRVKVGVSEGSFTVHPRSRGEHLVELRQHVPPTGSSPLTRGTQIRLGFTRLRSRFIPAHAGNTRVDQVWLPPLPVHPRSRGEHRSPTPDSARVAGSSPLTRGTLPAGIASAADTRFIPAHAGNTVNRLTVRFSYSVHPRSRGEHPKIVRFSKSDSGSSPLTRGTR